MAPVTLRVALVLCLLPAAGDLPTVGWEKVAATARSHLARGDFEAARQSAGRGFDRWRDRKFSKWHWEFRLTLAESLLELSRLEEAKPLLQVVPPASPLLQGRRLLDLAYLNYRTRNFTAAGQYLDFAESLVAATPELAAKVHLIRGMAHLKQERYREAEASFRLVTSSLSGSGSLLECYAFINLGHLFLLEFRYDEALALFERARAISVEIGV